MFCVTGAEDTEFVQISAVESKIFRTLQLFFTINPLILIYLCHTDGRYPSLIFMLTY